MLIEYIERLRTRPLAQRRRFALLFSGFVTLIIAALWGLTLPARFASLELNFNKATEEGNATSTVGTDAEDQNAIQGLINIQETFKGKPPAAMEGGSLAQFQVSTSTATGSNPSPSPSVIIIATSTNEAP